MGFLLRRLATKPGEKYGTASVFGNTSLLALLLDAGQNLLAECQTITALEKLVIFQRLARKFWIHIFHPFAILGIQQGFCNSAIKYLGWNLPDFAQFCQMIVNVGSLLGRPDRFLPVTANSKQCSEPCFSEFPCFL